MRFPDFIENLPELDLPWPGVTGYLLQASKLQVAFFITEKDSTVPEHSHAAQLEIPLEGSAEMTIAGRTEVFGPGQAIYIPSGVPHSGKVKGPYTAVIIVDDPKRYSAKKR